MAEINFCTCTRYMEYMHNRARYTERTTDMVYFFRTQVIHSIKKHAKSPAGCMCSELYSVGQIKCSTPLNIIDSYITRLL